MKSALLDKNGKSVVPAEWEGTEYDVTWSPNPLSEIAIDITAVLYGDTNPIHMGKKAASDMFGKKEAPGRVAHGLLVIGIAGGIISKKYQLGLHELTLKITACFCPRDRVGVLSRITFDEIKMGLRIVRLEVFLLRKRGKVVTLVPKKVPMTVQLRGSSSS